MAKRFTDTDKWRKDFFRSLQAPYKIIWLYLLDDCNHAGVWEVEIDVLKIRTQIDKSKDEILNVFMDKIEVFDGGKKWFIKDFIDFQYSELKESNRAHLSVINLLDLYKNKGLVRGLQGAKDKVKDKAKDKEGFELFWNKYHTITKLKKSDKEPTEKYWIKLSIEEKEKALTNIKYYYESIDNKKFCKKCRTYLSDKNFNDEFKKVKEIPKHQISEQPIILDNAPLANPILPDWRTRIGGKK